MGVGRTLPPPEARSWATPQPASAQPPQPVRRRIAGWRKWLLRLLLVILAPALFVVSAEIALRWFGCGHSTDFFVSVPQREAYTANDKFSRRFGCRENPAPFLMSAEKPAGTIRIFVLGESAARGTPNPSFSFSRILEAMLRRRYPEAKLEVINTAVMGINSHAIRPIALECTRHEPDLLIAYMGNNEAIGFYGVGGGIYGATPSLPVIRASLWAKTTGLGQLLGKWLSRDPLELSKEPQDLAFFMEYRVSADDPRRTAVCKNFRANLDDICRAARAAQTKTLLCTLAVNLKDFPPLGSLHRSDLTESELARWEAAYSEGIAAAAAGRHEQAIERFAAAAGIDDRFADLHFRLGRCYLAAGRFDEAREHYVLACDLDALQFRADRRLNEVIREAASAHADHGVVLVDAERALADCEASEHGIVGDQLFFEHVHLNFRGNCELARALFPSVVDALGEKLGESAGAGVLVPSEHECAGTLALTRWDRFKMGAEMAALTARPPFTGQLEHAERQQQVERSLLSGELTFRPEDYQGSIETYAAAIKRNPGDCHLRYNFAVLLCNHQAYLPAVDELKTVLQILPCHREARVLLGRTLARQGKVDEAISTLTEALQTDPEDAKAQESLAAVRSLAGPGEAASGAEAAPKSATSPVRVDPDAIAHVGRGNMLARQGKAVEALEEYRRAVHLCPDVSAFRNNLGAAMLSTGDVDGAIVHLSKAVQLAPDHARAHCNLAEALTRRGSHKEAVKHLRRAIDLRISSPEIIGRLAWLLATANDASLRDGSEAVRLAEQACRETGRKAPAALDGLAAAYAEAGRFEEAVRTASEAHQLASTRDNDRLTAAIAERIKLYQAGTAFHQE